MNAHEFTRIFFAVEQQLGLFDARAGDVPWWDVVRYEVYTRVYREQLDEPPVPAAPALPLAARLRARLERRRLALALDMRTALGDPDVLVFRAARQRRDGVARDAALDPLLALCPGRPLVVNTFPHYYHRHDRPSRRERSALPDGVDDALCALSAALPRPLQEAALKAAIADCLGRFERARRDYRLWLERLRPRFVLMTQNGIEKALFAVAHEAGVPLIEVQHGLINLAHPAYSYPPGTDGRKLGTFPAYFLTFSDYWSRSCHYPADQCISIGNDDFFIEPVPLPPDREGDVMVVSAEPYHATLLPWVLELAQRLPHRRIVYKLHPNQHYALAAIRDAFAVRPNVQVVGSEQSARELTAGVQTVVLIQSTVAHEALQAGRRLCVLPLMNYQVLADLFELPGVHVTPTVEALIERVTAPPSANATAQVFFDRLDAGKAQRLLQQLYQAPHCTADNGLSAASTAARPR